MRAVSEDLGSDNQTFLVPVCFVVKGVERQVGGYLCFT